MLEGISPAVHSCPTPDCENRNRAVSAGRRYFQRFGYTRSKSARWRCKACGALFSVAQRAGLRQRKTDKNPMIFTLLVNKSPMRRICKVLGIAPPTLYQRIGYFEQQCRQLAQVYEGKLLSGEHQIRRLEVAVDRQDYMINWTNQADRRNVQLHAVASADMTSGYIFGLHLDFDEALDPAVIEADAKVIDDSNVHPAFRRYARVWLLADYLKSTRGSRKKKETVERTKRKVAAEAPAGVAGDISMKYAEADLRDDIEVAVEPDYDIKLPTRGMQVHSEYTLYGHFYYLERLLRGAGKIRFYLDQEPGIRAACLAAFVARIKAREVDAFFVRINKEMTVNERRRARARAAAAFEKEKQRFPGLDDWDIQLRLIEERLSHLAELGRWKDQWLVHPFPSMSEPEKAVCCLTRTPRDKPDEMAKLYRRASLHAIDRFFMQLRRSVNVLERPMQTASASRRIWHGYNPYNPVVVVRLLEIYRVYYNYLQPGEDGKTPAMRLGLADRPISVDELLKFVSASANRAIPTVRPQ